MCIKIANALDLDEDCVSVKAKTAEHMLCELGHSDAVVAQAVVLLEEN
jgi:2C-methyl-D-erythritol 2,4-cyclodiphosphate synthase